MLNKCIIHWMLNKCIIHWMLNKCIIHPINIMQLDNLISVWWLKGLKFDNHVNVLIMQLINSNAGRYLIIWFMKKVNSRFIHIYNNR
jgi:hypothetical protein